MAEGSPARHLSLGQLHGELARLEELARELRGEIAARWRLETKGHLVPDLGFVICMKVYIVDTVLYYKSYGCCKQILSMFRIFKGLEYRLLLFHQHLPFRNPPLGFNFGDF